MFGGKTCKKFWQNLSPWQSKSKKSFQTCPKFFRKFLPRISRSKKYQFCPRDVKTMFPNHFFVKMSRNDQNSREKNAQTSKISGIRRSKGLFWMVLCRVGNFCSTQDMEKFHLKLSVNFAVKNIQKLNSASIEFFFPFLPELGGGNIDW